MKAIGGDCAQSEPIGRNLGYVHRGSALPVPRRTRRYLLHPSSNSVSSYQDEHGRASCLVTNACYLPPTECVDSWNQRACLPECNVLRSEDYLLNVISFCLFTPFTRAAAGLPQVIYEGSKVLGGREGGGGVNGVNYPSKPRPVCKARYLSKAVCHCYVCVRSGPRTPAFNLPRISLDWHVILAGLPVIAFAGS